MKKLFSAFAVLTAFAIFATSCNDDEKQIEETILVSEVKVTPATASLVAGMTLELKAQVLPENATNKEVKWLSRDTKVATIDEKTGVVTGLTVGEVDIVAQSGGKNGFAKLTITAAPIRVESVSIGEDFPLFVGAYKQLTATITPTNATTQTVVWDSSNKAAATVDETGKVTAVGAGETNITATVDEKVGTCKVTVSIPEIDGITMPNLDAVAGSTVKMTAAGFKAGDKINLESLVGEITATADVKNITAADAEFDLPVACTKDRSYKITVMRDGAAKAEAYLRPDNNFITMPYALGYYMTGNDEVVDNDAAMHGSRRGYMKGSIVDYNKDTREFRVWLADAKLAPLTFSDQNLNVVKATGVTSLAPLKGLDLSAVKVIRAEDSHLTELDMTMFPNITELRAWGDPGSQLNKIATINFGTAGTDPWCKLTHVQLERQSLKGMIDLRNCPYLKELSCQDNQIEGINFGVANQDQVLMLYSLQAENNKIVECNIENLGQIRQLKLAGNPIERLTLLNNSKAGTCIDGSTVAQAYVYLFKRTDSFSLTWASAAEAKGERVFNVENYWWRVFSASNVTETGDKGFEGGWVENGPIVKAQKDGVKVVCWTYHGQGDGTGTAGDSHIIPNHTHEGGSAPCNAIP